MDYIKMKTATGKNNYFVTKEQDPYSQAETSAPCF
jgi:hypothetical protein